MVWTVVPALEELRAQLDLIAPDRDRTSDGGVGDQAHADSTSSHNPDRTAAAEWRDGDAADEIRARDFDADLRAPHIGAGRDAARRVVRFLVMRCRRGELRHIRYIIFESVIYHRNVNNFAAREYTGLNDHDEHFHVNNEFTQQADTVRGVDYRLGELIEVTEEQLREVMLAVLRSAEGQKAIGTGTWNHRENDPATPDQTGTFRVGGWARTEPTRADARMAVILNALDRADLVDEVELANALIPLLDGVEVVAMLRRAYPDAEDRARLAERLQEDIEP